MFESYERIMEAEPKEIIRAVRRVYLLDHATFKTGRSRRASDARITVAGLLKLQKCTNAQIAKLLHRSQSAIHKMLKRGAWLVEYDEGFRSRLYRAIDWILWPDEQRAARYEINEQIKAIVAEQRGCETCG